jgi:hypothetical protein
VDEVEAISSQQMNDCNRLGGDKKWNQQNGQRMLSDVGENPPPVG